MIACEQTGLRAQSACDYAHSADVPLRLRRAPDRNAVISQVKRPKVAGFWARFGVDTAVGSTGQSNTRILLILIRVHHFGGCQCRCGQCDLWRWCWITVCSPAHRPLYDSVDEAHSGPERLEALRLTQKGDQSTASSHPAAVGSLVVNRNGDERCATFLPSF